MDFLQKIKEKIEEEDYIHLKNYIEEILEENENLQEEVDSLEFDVEEYRQEIKNLEEELDKKPENEEIKDLVNEIMEEHLFKYSYRKYDTYDKIINAFDRIWGY